MSVLVVLVLVADGLIGLRCLVKTIADEEPEDRFANAIALVLTCARVYLVSRLL